MLIIAPECTRKDSGDITLLRYVRKLISLAHKLALLTYIYTVQLRLSCSLSLLSQNAGQKAHLPICVTVVK